MILKHRTTIFKVAAAAYSLAAYGGQPAFDSSRPHTVVVLFRDDSRSQPDEGFAAGGEVLMKTIERDIAQPNTLVWLMDTKTDRPRPPYEFPAPARVRGDGDSAAQLLAAERARLEQDISSQVLGMSVTNMKAAVQTSVRLLNAYPRASRRLFVMVGDFVNDVPGTTPTAIPPDFGASFKGSPVEAALIVVTPKPKYLILVNMDAALHYSSVSDTWTTALRNIGASRVTVKPLDAFPITWQPNKPSQNTLRGKNTTDRAR